MQAEPAELVTVGEVAVRLRVSKATVYRLVKRGVVPVLRISNSIRVSAVAVDGMLSSLHGPTR